MTNEDKVIKARIGVFSGRENPEITLGGEAQIRFAEMVQASIGKEPAHPPGPPKLGTFYGFLVSVPPELADELSLPQVLEVRSGVVSVLTREESKHWRDIAGLEDFLIDLAFEQGHGKILGMLGIKHRQKEQPLDR
jgi:hypothetical protein